MEGDESVFLRAKDRIYKGLTEGKLLLADAS